MFSDVFHVVMFIVYYWVHPRLIITSFDTVYCSGPLLERVQVVEVVAIVLGEVVVGVVAVLVVVVVVVIVEVVVVESVPGCVEWLQKTKDSWCQQLVHCVSDI